MTSTRQIQTAACLIIGDEVLGGKVGSSAGNVSYVSKRVEG
jgi:hypothetical protein